MQTDELKKKLTEGLKDYGRTGLRWSYLIIALLAIAGFIVNFFLPHGWVIWPVVLSLGIMIMINEATARNNQGLPPFVVYGWFIVALAIWIAAAVIFSAIFPILVVVGTPATIVYAIYAHKKNKKRSVQNAQRRASGLCIHCAQPVDVSLGVCEHCGKDITPEETSFLKRIQTSSRSEADVARTRDLLTPKPETVAAKRKEAALLAKRASSAPAGKQIPPSPSV